MTPLLAAVVVLVAVMALGVSQLGTAATRRARADGVADVSALAAAQWGTQAGSAVAAANGARLAHAGAGADGSVRVEVELRGTSASAAAAPQGELISGDPDPGPGRR